MAPLIILAVVLVVIQPWLKGHIPQRFNALKNGIAMLVNGVAAIIFVVAAHVAWEPAALIAVSSIVGGQAGASVGRRLSPVVLRGLLVVAGLVAVVKLLL